MDTLSGDPLAHLADLDDAMPAPAPGPVARARPALLLSFTLHLALVIVLLALEQRQPAATTTPAVLQVALRTPAAATAPAPLPVPVDATASTAREARDTPTDTMRALTQDARAPASIVTPPPAREAEAQAPATPATMPVPGDAPASEGMALGYMEVARDDYLDSINRWLRGKGIHYPPAARARGLQGRVLVKFALDRAGRLVDLRVSEGSGHPLLDEAALETVRRAAPFPPPPDSLPFATVSDIHLPVLFRLEGGRPGAR